MLDLSYLTDLAFHYRFKFHDSIVDLIPFFEIFFTEKPESLDVLDLCYGQAA